MGDPAKIKIAPETPGRGRAFTFAAEQGELGEGGFVVCRPSDAWAFAFDILSEAEQCLAAIELAKTGTIGGAKSSAAAKSSGGTLEIVLPSGLVLGAGRDRAAALGEEALIVYQGMMGAVRWLVRRSGGASDEAELDWPRIGAGAGEAPPPPAGIPLPPGFPTPPKIAPTLPPIDVPPWILPTKTAALGEIATVLTLGVVGVAALAAAAWYFEEVDAHRTTLQADSARLAAEAKAQGDAITGMIAAGQADQIDWSQFGLIKGLASSEERSSWSVPLIVGAGGLLFGAGAVAAAMRFASAR